MAKAFTFVVAILFFALVVVTGIKTQRLNAELASARSKIVELEAEFQANAAREEEHEKLRESFTNSQQELEFLKKAVEEKTARIDDLSKEGTALQDQITSLEAELEEARSTAAQTGPV